MRIAIVASMGLAAGCGRGRSDTQPPEAAPITATAPAETSTEADLGDGSPVLMAPVESPAVEPETAIDTTVRTDGALDPERVTEVVDGHLEKDIQPCFQAAIERTRNERLHGVVEVVFEITAAGKVQGASAGASSLGDAEAAACMVGKVGAWKFPKAATPTKVVFPFRFGGS